jgi:hypothetical protein
LFTPRFFKLSLERRDLTVMPLSESLCFLTTAYGDIAFGHTDEGVFAVIVNERQPFGDNQQSQYYDSRHMKAVPD